MFGSKSCNGALRSIKILLPIQSYSHIYDQLFDMQYPINKVATHQVIDKYVCRYSHTKAYNKDSSQGLWWCY